MPFEAEKYEDWQRERFSTLPGLTGLWQVSGKNKTTFDEMVHLDIRYAREKSVVLDLKIMILTIPTLVLQVVETRLRGMSSKRSTAATAVASHRPAGRILLSSQPYSNSPKSFVSKEGAL